MEGLLGRKLGMTQIYATDGRVVPVTVVQAGPCLVVQRRTSDSDGYEAVQLGLVEDRALRSVPKPMKGHFDKGGVAPMRNGKTRRASPVASSVSRKTAQSVASPVATARRSPRTFFTKRSIGTRLSMPITES